ncbi:Protein ZNF783 [Sciurus carolinensis]|uniref:Protein ZNF783 n=1 Tax=Sciurus carolinensis TaxID=30640 RepID=A0AA41MW45_SCICA|nr:Protein ZNF783 [Sciurus carolinensis]
MQLPATGRSSGAGRLPLRRQRLRPAPGTPGRPEECSPARTRTAMAEMAPARVPESDKPMEEQRPPTPPSPQLAAENSYLYSTEITLWTVVAAFSLGEEGGFLPGPIADSGGTHQGSGEEADQQQEVGLRVWQPAGEQVGHAGDPAIGVPAAAAAAGEHGEPAVQQELMDPAAATWQQRTGPQEQVPSPINHAQEEPKEEQAPQHQQDEEAGVIPPRVGTGSPATTSILSSVKQEGKSSEGESPASPPRDIMSSLGPGGGGMALKTETQSEDEMMPEQLLLGSPSWTKCRIPKGHRNRTGGPRRHHAQGMPRVQAGEPWLPGAIGETPHVLRHWQE